MDVVIVVQYFYLINIQNYRINKFSYSIRTGSVFVAQQKINKQFEEELTKIAKKGPFQQLNAKVTYLLTKKTLFTFIEFICKFSTNI